MSKLEAINSLDIKEWDVDGTELLYVLVEATEDNINALLQAGFTMTQLEATMDPHRETMDISILAFKCTEADEWSVINGFQNGFTEAQICTKTG